jgi:hypothetical protein
MVFAARPEWSSFSIFFLHWHLAEGKNIEKSGNGGRNSCPKNKNNKK